MTYLLASTSSGKCHREIKLHSCIIIYQVLETYCTVVFPINWGDLIVFIQPNQTEILALKSLR